MDIYAKAGTKVIFKYPMNGMPGDQKYAQKHLIEGETYTVQYTEVHNWNTDVVLREHPGKKFNSVHFWDPTDEPDYEEEESEVVGSTDTVLSTNLDLKFIGESLVTYYYFTAADKAQYRYDKEMKEWHFLTSDFQWVRVCGELPLQMLNDAIRRFAKRE